MVTTMMTNDAKASMANLLRVVLGVVEDAHRAGVVEHLLARREEHVRLDVLRALKRRDSFEKKRVKTNQVLIQQHTSNSSNRESITQLTL